METNSKSKVRQNITGLFLCAGMSGRMGASKALMIHEELPFAVTILKKLLLVCSEVSVVLGHESEKVKAVILNYLDKTEISKLRFALNENYKSGMFSSLQCGLKNQTNADWILYHFVDQPTIPISFYSEFVSQLSGQVNWLQPSFKNNHGHPILFNNDVVKRILESDKNKSLRDIKNDNLIKPKIWECNYPEVLQDVDTLEQYNNLAVKQ